MQPPISPDPDIANCDCFEENMLDSLGVLNEDLHKPISPEQQRRFLAFKYTSRQHLNKWDNIDNETPEENEKQPEAEIPECSKQYSVSEKNVPCSKEIPGVSVAETNHSPASVVGICYSNSSSSHKMEKCTQETLRAFPRKSPHCAEAC